MEWSLFLPLILAALAFGAMTAAAGVTASRGNEERAERLRDIGFLIVLLSGAWIVVLLLMALVSEPDEIWDMVVITVVMVVFFILLLLAFYLISQLIGLIGRALSRRKRVTTQEL